MENKAKIGTVYPPIKEVEFDGKEMFFGKKMYLSIAKKYYVKTQIKLFKELFNNFTAGISKLTVIQREDDKPVVYVSKEIENVELPLELGDNDYAIAIDDKKAQLVFSDNKSFAHAYCTMLAVLEIKETKKGKEKFSLPICTIKDKPVVKFRSAHLSVLYGNFFQRTRKLVREIGFLKYTHVIIVFKGGNFPWKSFKEYGRKEHYSIKQVRTIIEEANALGMDVIPELNIWGHASMSTGRYGKHIALDQNPKVAPYFNKTGWVWNILSPEVKELHHKMIEELIDVCGPCEYFHVGCDESVTFGEDRDYIGKDRTKIVCDYINDMANWLKEKGRKTMIWGDMLLCNPEWKEILQSGESPEEVRRTCEMLDKEIIVIDWQYDVATHVDLPSTKSISDYGFKTMIAPWRSPVAIKICADNVIRHGYAGYVQTTWGIIISEICILARGAIATWEDAEKSLAESEMKIMMNMGEFIRKLLPPKGSYLLSGTKKREIVE